MINEASERGSDSDEEKKEDMEAKFLRELKSNHLTIKGVKKDDNSIFRAISVGIHGTQGKYKEVRQQLVTYLWDNLNPEVLTAE